MKNEIAKAIPVAWSAEFSETKEIRVKRLHGLIIKLHRDIIEAALRESPDAFESRRIRNENNYQNSFADR